MERRSGINSGYLSQLERNEIAQPTPSVLGRIAGPYGEPVEVLMEWAGYIATDPKAISPNRKRALNFIPDDISDREVQALRAVLEALRGEDTSANALAGRPHRYDIEHSAEERALMRATALALLREGGAERRVGAVDLEETMRVAELVKVGEIELDLNKRRKLRERFGNLVDGVLRNLLGVVNLDSREVFIQPNLYGPRRRFVFAHEIAHAALPDHKEFFAHLDDRHRINPAYNDLLESQANQFAIELLAKGDLLREEFDGSRPSMGRLVRSADLFEISVQAAARRIAEESRQDVAVAIAWRTFGGKGPFYLQGTKLITSPSFQRRFGWQASHPTAAIIAAMRQLDAGGKADSFIATDAAERRVVMTVEGRDLHYALIAMFVPEPKRSGLRILRAGMPARSTAAN
jgi:Zn-dependent peptidase ImmA (M78 family)